MCVTKELENVTSGLHEQREEEYLAYLPMLYFPALRILFPLLQKKGGNTLSGKRVKREKELRDMDHLCGMLCQAYSCK